MTNESLPIFKPAPVAVPALQGLPVLRLGFRPFYIAGTLFAALALPIWLVMFFGQLAWTPNAPPLLWHAHEMLFGFAVAIIVGFLLTAAKAWTGLPTARGPVLDEAALIESLSNGRVAAAGLDVFEREPLSEDSLLRRHPRVVLSDHAAWYSEDSLAELKRTVAEAAAQAGTGGLPVAIANPEVLHKLGRFEEWTPNYNAQWRARRADSLKAAHHTV